MREADMKCKVAWENTHWFIRGKLSCDDDTIAKPVEVALIERREVELRLAICRQPRTSTRPRLRRHAEMEADGSGL